MIPAVSYFPSEIKVIHCSVGTLSQRKQISKKTRNDLQAILTLHLETDKECYAVLNVCGVRRVNHLLEIIFHNSVCKSRHGQGSLVAFSKCMNNSKTISW